MLTLYYAPDNASVVLRLALEEAGLAFETRLVDRKTKQQKSPEYLALNPAGLIPTLITADGPISETGACLLWLVDRHPEAGLGHWCTTRSGARSCAGCFSLPTRCMRI